MYQVSLNIGQYICISTFRIYIQVSKIVERDENKSNQISFPFIFHTAQQICLPSLSLSCNILELKSSYLTVSFLGKNEYVLHPGICNKGILKLAGSFILNIKVLVRVKIVKRFYFDIFHDHHENCHKNVFGKIKYCKVFL